MPDPICLHLGKLAIHWYGVMMALGFLAGLATWVVLGRGTPRDLNYCSDLLFWIMVGGIGGARLAYVAANFGRFAAEPLSIVRVDQGGLVFYGGFAGALVAVAVFARRRRERFWSVADFTVTALPLGHAFGRLGCWLNGCCYGAPGGGPLGVCYPIYSAPWWRQAETGLIGRTAPAAAPVHPVQLYEAAWNLVLYPLLLYAYRRRWREGRVAALYLALYPLGRFFLEPLRGDERLRWDGLTAAQWGSLAALAAGLLLLLRSFRSAAAADDRRRES